MGQMKIALLFFSLSFSVLANISAGYGQTELQLKNDAIQAQVEVLIVCDVECFHRFQGSRQKLIDYWYVYMWDINMRFKTLPSVDIDFRVTSILAINTTEDQPFVEKARAIDGTIMLKAVWSRFGEWVYANEKTLPPFDVALLITGAKQAAHDEYLAYEESDFGSTACLKNDTSNLHLSTIVLHSTATWGYHCAALEAAFAELLGASYDSITECRNQDYLMTSGKCNNNQYAFSKCSDEAIFNFVKTSQAACLRTTEAPEMDALSEAAVTHAPSLNDQCVMLTNNNNAVALSAEKEHQVDSCVISKCAVYENGNWTFLRWLFPVDNSLCGGGNVCFRGRCLPQAVQFRNVGAGLCLHPNKNFGPIEFPNVENCLPNPTPLDQVRIVDRDEERFGKYLATPTTLPFTDDRDQDECLSNYFDIQNISHLEYSSCLTTDEDYIGWDLVELEKRNNEFLMHHRFTNSCARVDTDNIIRLYECDGNDLRMQWTYVNQPLVPLSVVGNDINFILEGVGKAQENYREEDATNVFSATTVTISISIPVVAYICLCIAIFAIAIYSVSLYIKRKRSREVISYEALRVQ